MESFKQFLINEAIAKKSMETEAILVLRKIIDMVDDAHVDYSDKKIVMNVGRVIHDKKYNNLDIFIVKSDKIGTQIGRHSSHEKHGIFIFTPKLPSRDKIDDFLTQKERSGGFKSVFAKFLHDANIDETNDYEGTRVEQTNKLNTREEFENLYREALLELETIFSNYNQAKKALVAKMDKASEDMGEREILKAAANKLRNDMLGSSVEEFKRKAISIIGDKYKLLNKEFKEKLESRLESFYETKIK